MLSSRRVRALSIGLMLGFATAAALPASALAAKPARASSTAKKAVVVGVISGPQGPKIRNKVLDVLRKSGLYEVTDAEDVKPNDKPANYARLATALQVEGIVVGTVTKRYDLTLTVYGANGVKIDTLQLKGGNPAKLQKTIDNELEISIADPLANASAPARAGTKPAPAAKPAAAKPAAAKPAPKALAPGEEEEEEAAPEDLGKAPKAAEEEPAEGEEPEASEGEGEEESESESASASTSDAKARGRRPIEAIVGLRGYNRKFNYTRTPDASLHSYELGLGPAILATARVYPGAFFTDNTWSHIGFQARYEFGIATSTEYRRANGTVAKLSTASSDLQLGLRGRLPLGEHELGVFGLFGAHAFSLRGDENPNADPYALVPDVNYKFLRVGVDARVAISKLVVGAHIAPRFILSMNEVDKPRVWFPGATASGLDFGLFGGWHLLPWLSAVGGIDVVRYGFDFNAIPDNNRVVAGGATDTYLSAWLGVMVSLESKPAAAVEAQ